MVEIELTSATVDDLAAVLALRRDVADSLTARGIDTWRTPLREELVAGWIAQRALWVCRDDDRIVGTIALLERDPEFWGDDPTPARYVHLLLVDRAYASQDLGGRILGCAEQLARATGARYLRLDAATDVEPLQRWYDQRGYIEVGHRGFVVGSDGLEITLRQKDLVAAARAARRDEPVLKLVTYLQMLDPAQLRAAKHADRLELRRVDDPLGDAAALRELHDRIAGPHDWSALGWSDERWRTWLRGAGQRHWYIEDDGRRIGWANVQAHDHGDVEIDHFGLVPEALGTGRGGAALTELTRQAWSYADALRRQRRHEHLGRVFLDTSSWDHPAALANYRARGFEIYLHQARLRRRPTPSPDRQAGV